ncbi:MAG: ribokinase [Planctomycetota bacterium]|nr:MAG: ribokinase [Planctomycetota bacterium]
MSEPARLCILGSLNMDYVVAAPALPRRGETLLGGPFATFPGGKGANQAVAAARLGAAVCMIGCVGADAQGAFLRNSLLQEGVDVAPVLERETTTGIALITVEPGGDNTIVVAPGANATLTTADVDASAGAVRGAQMLVAQLETPLMAVARAAHIARSADVPVLLNAAPAMDVPGPVLRLVDILVVNRGEARALLGAHAPADLPSLAMALLAQGPRRVVITLGDQGAVYSAGASFQTQPAFPVEAVDATAAGDAFTAALAVGLCEHGDAALALRFAAAAGALACTRRGAQPSLPARAQVEALLAQR